MWLWIQEKWLAICLPNIQDVVQFSDNILDLSRYFLYFSMPQKNSKSCQKKEKDDKNKEEQYEDNKQRRLL